MQSLLSHVPGKPVHVIRDVSVGAVVQESLGSLVTSFPTRQEQRRLILAILGVSVGSMCQQSVDGVHIVHTGRPVQGRLAVVVASVDIGLGVDELLDHSLDSQTSREDKWRRTIVSFGVQICSAMSQQDLENSLGISSNASVKWGSSSVIGSIGVRFSIQKLFSCVGPGVASGQMKGSFSSLVHLGIDLGTLSNKILNNSLRSLFVYKSILRNISTVKSTTSEGSQHERGKATGSSHIHIIDSSLGAHHHVGLGRSEGSENVWVLDISRVHVLLRPCSVIIAIVSYNSLS